MTWVCLVPDCQAPDTKCVCVCVCHHMTYCILAWPRGGSYECDCVQMCVCVCTTVCVCVCHDSWVHHSSVITHQSSIRIWEVVAVECESGLSLHCVAVCAVNAWRLRTVSVIAATRSPVGGACLTASFHHRRHNSASIPIPIPHLFRAIALSSQLRTYSYS